MARERFSALWMFVAFSWVAACLWFPLTDTDIWWHLASAKLMWARKAFLREDPFCLSSFGAPWADLHWGFQGLAYAAWKLGGAKLLVAGKCLAVAGAFAFAIKPHFDRRTLSWLIPFTAFGVYHLRFFIDVRPLALTLLGLGIQYAAVTSYLRGNLRRPWLILVPVQIALVNIQGLYPLGAWLVSCLTLGEFLARKAAYPGNRWRNAARRVPEGWAVSGEGMLPERRAGLRPLAWTCLVLWGAGLASPYGLSGFALPLSLFGRIAPVSSNIFSSQIAENLPLTDLIRHRPWEALPFLLMGVLVLYTFDRARARTGPGHVLLFLSFAALGWMAQRNLPLAFLGGLMAMGHNLQVSLAASAAAASPARAVPWTRWRPWRQWTGLAVLLAIFLVYGPKVRAAWDFELPGSLETPFRFPVQAAAYMKEHPLPGNLFNELRYGGYLNFMLYPDKLSFVDGRMILRSGEFYRDFLAVTDHPDRFPAYASRYAFTQALLPISEDQRFLPLAAYLAKDLGWELLYCDGASAFLAEPETFAAYRPSVVPVREAIRDRFGANPRLESIALRNAARFLRAAGREGAAASLRKTPPGSIPLPPLP